MPDICDLVLDDHATFRRRFGDLDEHRDADGDQLAKLWKPLGDLLELHAAVEERIFYPCLLETGTQAKEETEDAIKDHNEIRDAVALAGEQAAGSSDWWSAVDAAREQNSDHMAEEERGAIADLRKNAAPELRDELGVRWLSFREEHAALRGIEVEDKDPGSYLKHPG